VESHALVKPRVQRAALPRVLLRATSGVVLVLGCAQIFGIEEACEFGKNGCGAGGSSGAAGMAPCAPGEPGCPVDDPVGLECDQYCAQMREECASPPQYADAELREEDAPRATECESLCRHFPSAGGESRVGNTRECRLDRITGSSGDRAACLAAGRGGQGPPGTTDDCGTNCEAYCSLMRALCPAHFGEFAPSESAADDLGACIDGCGRLSDRGDFDSTLLGIDETDVDGDATIQCRLWHLGFAAIMVEQAGAFDNMHCDHAMGFEPCNPTPP